MYNNLVNDEDTTPTQYKHSWMLDSAASGNYGDTTMYIRNASKIMKGTGISVGCAAKFNLMIPINFFKLVLFGSSCVVF